MPPDAPFIITVCGLEELAGHAERQVSHVLSILDPEQPEPEAFGAYGECVREPDELSDAIDRCLAALDDGKAAVLHVHITRL